MSTYIYVRFSVIQGEVEDYNIFESANSSLEKAVLSLIEKVKTEKKISSHILKNDQICESLRWLYIQKFEVDEKSNSEQKEEKYYIDPESGLMCLGNEPIYYTINYDRKTSNLLDNFKPLCDFLKEIENK